MARAVGGDQERNEGAFRVAGSYGFGGPLHYAYGYRELPGAGAMQVAFDTLCLPRYSPFGGVANRAAFDPNCNAMVQLHGVVLDSIGGPGINTGGFYAAPLNNVNPADVTPATLAAMMLTQDFRLPPK